LLHGLGGASSAWEAVARSLSPRKVIVPDLLGFGRSPRSNSAYSIEEHLDALLRLVRNKGLQNERFDLAGHSMGAILAAAFASRHQDLVRGLALAGLPIYRSREQALERSKELGILARWILGESPMAKIMCQLMCLLRPGLIMAAPYFLPGLPPNVARDAFRHDTASFFGSLQNVVLGDRLDGILDSLSQRPVLVIHGESDKIAPFELVQRLPKKYPGWRYEFVANGGHLMPIKQPELVAQLLRDIPG